MFADLLRLGHQPLQRPKKREEMGKEYPVYEPSRDKPRGPHELPHSRAADKPRIFVIAAGVDRTDGERVPWIVFKDEAQAVALQNASQLRNKDRVLRVIDVMKEAVVLLSASLEEIGDVYAIYGFSSHGRRNVEVYPVKAFAESLSPEVKSRMITDFKEQTQAVLSRVGDATGNFREIDRLDSVRQLPPPVSESVASLVDRARDFRAKVGYETALSECRSETETVDALSAVDQGTRNIAGNDASAANSGLTDFLKDNPEPMVDTQRPLWRYLTSMRLLCSRLEKEAEIHLERAGAFASAGRTGDAIREYQEAYRIFPNPAAAEKIRQLQRNSLGL